METGTEKTYVYTRLMYELHKKYGLFKFIIVVPTPSIKEGTKNFITSEYVHPDELARYYRNLGYYYVEKGQYQLAANCDIFSQRYYKSPMVRSELKYIAEMDKSVNIRPNIMLVRAEFADQDIPLTPDENIVKLAYQMIDQEDKKKSQYYLEILGYFLKKDELKDLQKKINKL